MKKISKVNLDSLYKELKESRENEEREKHSKCSKDPIYRGTREDDKELSKALEEIIGAKIIDAGFIGDVEGGLTFDVEKNGKIMRLVIGYTELGEWVEYFGRKGS